MNEIGRNSTLSFASSVALCVSRAVACESFWFVRLKYCGAGEVGTHVSYTYPTVGR